jgi:hypothetical protein
MGKILERKLIISPWAGTYREQSNHSIMGKIIQGTI